MLVPLRRGPVARGRRVPAVESGPSVAGMCAGWALGDAMTNLLSELRNGVASNFCGPAPLDMGPPDCTGFSFSKSGRLFQAPL